jgi:hypothetical protein
MRRTPSLAPWRAVLGLVSLLGLLALGACDDETPNGNSDADLTEDSTQGDLASDLGDDDIGGEDLRDDQGEDQGEDLAQDQGPDAPVGCQSDGDCDNGVYCDGVERCFDGACVGVSALPCGDLNECTRGACNEETDQCDYAVDDALCAPGQRCDPKAGCFLPSQCGQDSDCDDGLICNGAEVCDLQAGRCGPGLPPDCDDAIDCTVDVCIEEIGGCENQPNHLLCLPNELCNLQLGCEQRPPCASDDDCDDALFCNGVESCDVQTGLCRPGDLPTRGDDLDCTVDNCSNALAMVTHTPNPARCSDGLFCNGAEVCHPVDGCVAGAPPVLSDGVGCTADNCDEDADFIEHIPNDTACEDGLFCNGAEVCHPVDGCQPGEPVALNDGVGCTVDSCDEIGRQVVHVPTDSRCDDDLFCNGEETCDADAGCVRGPAPTTEDALDCTEGSCDEERDMIVQAPFHERCADGLFCNGAESCDLARGCVAGAAPVVDDGIACTDDACDEEANAVTHAPVDARCDNDLFCDGAERCDLDRGCVSGAAPALEDGVDCTRGSCDEANDRVVQTPDDGLCGDGLFCNGAETCDPARGCQVGVAPAVDDQIPCTVDSCDEGRDLIVHAPNNALCDNGDACDGAELCAPGLGCQDAAPPAQGAVCGDTPRQICLAQTCSVSECGDGFHDPGNGEGCDDGDDDNNDDCRDDCTINPGMVLDVNGAFGLLPDTSYTCTVFGVVTVIQYTFTSFRFQEVGNQLIVTALPANQTPAVVMTGALPAGRSFTVSQVVPGTCTETYTLMGAFAPGNDNVWNGTFTRTLQGSCFECVGATTTLRGTRQ